MWGASAGHHQHLHLHPAPEFPDPLPHLPPILAAPVRRCNHCGNAVLPEGMGGRYVDIFRCLGANLVGFLTELWTPPPPPPPPQAPPVMQAPQGPPLMAPPMAPPPESPLPSPVAEPAAPAQAVRPKDAATRHPPVRPAADKEGSGKRLHGTVAVAAAAAAAALLLPRSKHGSAGASTSSSRNVDAGADASADGPVLKKLKARPPEHKPRPALLQGSTSTSQPGPGDGPLPQTPPRRSAPPDPRRAQPKHADGHIDKLLSMINTM